MELKSVTELQMAIFRSLFIGADEPNWFFFADACKCAISSDLQGRTFTLPKAEPVHTSRRIKQPRINSSNDGFPGGVTEWRLGG